jgi:RHS repeat-associated protein
MPHDGLSTRSTKYMYLPTASGPMPIMAFVGGHKYAVHADHLNTPRRLTRSNGRPTWQWAYSAFGDEEPTTAAKRFTSPYTVPTTGSTNVPEAVFNLRYPGQYADKESGLFYNYFRSYDARTGRYSQSDPIGLRGGFNRFNYVDANPLKYTDPLGLINQEAQRQLNEWFGPKTPSGNCATAECAAGLTPAPSENRSQKEVDYGQCKMVCQISLAVPVAACNAVLGGGLAGTAAAAVAKGGACTWVCK